MSRILIVNDDGIQSETLFATASILRPFGDVWVLVPDCDRSGTAHLLTLSRPVKVKDCSSKAFQNRFSCSGTPADCAYLGLSGVFGDVEFDLVVSGINNGLNVADAIPYSGTVAGAREASLLDVPSMAVSVESITESSIRLAGQLTYSLAFELLHERLLLPRGSFVNVNVPRCPVTDSYAITKVGRRSYTKEVKKVLDPKGGEYWWIGGTALDRDTDLLTDCYSVISNAVASVSICSTHDQHLDLISVFNGVNLGTLSRV